ncbi:MULTISPECIES: hypothetical protein [unclassified Streptomyces]|uniref:hypothetical protein n=1 Tax=unclassified Streptomyces TaxID=2593676 RepID=UPI002E2BBEB3|nr:hypothetical protein [Streptomyces sp. NBC_00223]
MDAPHSAPYDQPLPQRPPARLRPGGALACAALATGVAVLVLAMVLPIETVDSGHPGRQPRDTLYQVHGALVLLPAAVPLLVAALVTAALYAGRHDRPRWALPVAWVLSIALLGTAVAGFLTFLIGIFVVPTGVLLAMATYEAQHGRHP